MKNYLQKGSALTLVAAAAVASGDLVVKGVIAGVAGTDAKVGEDVEVHVEGCYRLKKVPAQVWAAGDAVYADPVNLVCNKTPTDGFVLIGVAIAPAANPSSYGDVRLNGAFAAAPVDI